MIEHLFDLLHTVGRRRSARPSSTAARVGGDAFDHFGRAGDDLADGCGRGRSARLPSGCGCGGWCTWRRRRPARPGPPRVRGSPPGGVYQAADLDQRAGDERGARVVAIAQPVGGAGGQRDHVLQRAAQLDADEVASTCRRETSGRAAGPETSRQRTGRRTRPRPPSGSAAPDLFGVRRPGQHRDAFGSCASSSAITSDSRCSDGARGPWSRAAPACQARGAARTSRAVSRAAREIGTSMHRSRAVQTRPRATWSGETGGGNVTPGRYTRFSRGGFDLRRQARRADTTIGPRGRRCRAAPPAPSPNRQR